MRPKKRILLIDSNENRMSVHRCLFTTWSFAVISATSDDDAREVFAAYDLDLVVACWPLANADLGKLLNELRACKSGVHSLLLAEQLTVAPENTVADAVMLKGACTPSQILERVKLLTACKRGPKPPVQSVDRMMMLAQGRTA